MESDNTEIDGFPAEVVMQWCEDVKAMRHKLFSKESSKDDEQSWKRLEKRV